MEEIIIVKILQKYFIIKMGQHLSSQQEQQEGFLQKDKKYDEKALARIANKFNSEDTSLKELLAEQLEGEINQIDTMLRQQLEGDANNPDAPKPDLTPQMAAVMTLKHHVGDYLQRVKPEAIRERNKIKVKLTNAKRFVLSHLKNLYENQALLLKEIDQLRYAYIDNFLQAHQKLFQTENKLSYDLLQMRRTRVQNFSQDSKKTTVSGPGGNHVQDLPGEQR